MAKNGRLDFAVNILTPSGPNGVWWSGFVEVAKTDHLVYKFNIYQVVMGNSNMTADDFADHTTCRLGKWYFHGDGHACFSKLPGFAEMDKPHKRVHAHGRAAVTAYCNRDIAATLAELEQMELASVEVLDCLEKMAIAAKTSADIVCTSIK